MDLEQIENSFNGLLPELKNDNDLLHQNKKESNVFRDSIWNITKNIYPLLNDNQDNNNVFNDTLQLHQSANIIQDFNLTVDEKLNINTWVNRAGCNTDRELQIIGKLVELIRLNKTAMVFENYNFLFQNNAKFAKLVLKGTLNLVDKKAERIIKTELKCIEYASQATIIRTAVGGAEGRFIRIYDTVRNQIISWQGQQFVAVSHTWGRY